VVPQAGQISETQVKQTRTFFFGELKDGLRIKASG
jgi:hypothetical protein